MACACGSNPYQVLVMMRNTELNGEYLHVDAEKCCVMNSGYWRYTETFETGTRHPPYFAFKYCAEISQYNT